MSLDANTVGGWVVSTNSHARCVQVSHCRVSKFLYHLSRLRWFV